MIDLDALDSVGYITSPLIDSSAMAHLTDLYRSLDLADDIPFFASANDLDRVQASTVSKKIHRLVAPQLQARLPSHRAFLCSFLSKGRLDGARIAFHQDLTYTDERLARAVVVWVPLTNTDGDSGALSMIPGSHRWTSGSRPSGTAALPTEPHQSAFSRLSHQLTVPAGTAVFYDAASVHGSPPNATSEVRVAVGIALIPVGAQLVHVHADDLGKTSSFAVDDAYYLEQGLRSRPVGYPSYPEWATPVEPNDFEPHLAASPI